MTDVKQNHNTFDLTLVREVPVSPELVWKAWTTPELLKEWFCPKPWKTTQCEIDLRPGGRFNTVMTGPNGEEMPGEGCYLEVVERDADGKYRLTFTDCLTEGFRPAATSFMTATITLEPIEGGTRYTALAMHKNAEDCQSHADMGFVDGWGKALDQLVELMRNNP